MTRFRTVERSHYRTYWRRATELRAVMRHAVAEELFGAAASNAIHCLIATVDAVLVYRQGIRSAGEGHLEVAELLQRDRQLPDVGKAAAHLRKGLAKKNLVEYEDRDLTVPEAREIVDHAERLYVWAEEQLPRTAKESV